VRFETELKPSTAPSMRNSIHKVGIGGSVCVERTIERAVVQMNLICDHAFANESPGIGVEDVRVVGMP